MSGNWVLTEENDAGKLDLYKAEVTPEPAPDGLPDDLMNHGVAVARKAAQIVGGRVLVTVNAHVGDENESGFAPTHLSVTVSAVDPKAAEINAENQAAQDAAIATHEARSES